MKIGYKESSIDKTIKTEQEIHDFITYKVQSYKPGIGSCLISISKGKKIFKEIKRDELSHELYLENPTEVIEEIHHFITYNVPNWDIKGNNPYLLHHRIKLPLNILKNILIREWRKNIQNEANHPFDILFLRKLDLSELNLSNIDIRKWNLSYTNINLDPQLVKNKSLRYTNCAGLNFEGKDFTDVDLLGTNLKNTKAEINPQTIKNKSLCNTNCCGLNFKEKNFTDVNIYGANLEKTEANLPSISSINKSPQQSLILKRTKNRS